MLGTIALGVFLGMLAFAVFAFIIQVLLIILVAP